MRIKILIHLIERTQYEIQLAGAMSVSIAVGWIRLSFSSSMYDFAEAKKAHCFPYVPGCHRV
jgi:hypothetical protein